MAHSVQHLADIKINDEYGTPNLELKKAMIHYDILPFLDVSSTHRNAKFEAHLTKEDDALTKDWRLNFFMNPPYSQIRLWMKKAYSEHLKNNVDGLILVYSKTDTKWWHEFVEGKSEVHFIQGRLQFEINGIVPRYCYKSCKKVFYENIDYCPDCSLFEPVRLKKNTAPYPSCWIIYRKKRF